MDMNPARSQRFSLEDLYEKVKEILHGNQFKVLVMNGKMMWRVLIMKQAVILWLVETHWGVV